MIKPTHPKPRHCNDSAVEATPSHLIAPYYEEDKDRIILLGAEAPLSGLCSGNGITDRTPKAKHATGNVGRGQILYSNKSNEGKAGGEQAPYYSDLD